MNTKKVFSYILILLVTVLTFTACANDDKVTVEEPVEVEDPQDKDEVSKEEREKEIMEELLSLEENLYHSHKY